MKQSNKRKNKNPKINNNKKEMMKINKIIVY